eukprot:5618349-Amphidinium_carterae.1
MPSLWGTPLHSQRLLWELSGKLNLWRAECFDSPTQRRETRASKENCGGKLHNNFRLGGSMHKQQKSKSSLQLRDKSERQNGVLHVDLADMGVGHSNKRYELVMAATMTIDNKQLVMPFNSPLKRKDSSKVAELVAE